MAPRAMVVRAKVETSSVLQMMKMPAITQKVLVVRLTKRVEWVVIIMRAWRER